MIKCFFNNKKMGYAVFFKLRHFLIANANDQHYFWRHSWIRLFCLPHNILQLLPETFWTKFTFGWRQTFVAKCRTPAMALAVRFPTQSASFWDYREMGFMWMILRGDCVKRSGLFWTTQTHLTCAWRFLTSFGSVFWLIT